MSFQYITTTSIISTVTKAVNQGPRKVKIIFYISFILVFISIIVFSLFEKSLHPNFIKLIAGILGLVGGIGILGIYSYQIYIDESEAKNEIRIVEDKVKNNPNEPAAAWDLARIKLENYLNRNLAQIQWIFIWTVVIMIIGFMIIIYGVLRAYESSCLLNASVLTTVSGILIEFIGATFLVIYKSTMNQAKEFVNVLERINAVGMSVQILESIKNDKKLENKTRAEIAKHLLTLYSINSENKI